MANETWTIPRPSKKDGWHEVPTWVISGGAIPYPKDKWTLKDGTIAAGGDVLTWRNGVTVKEPTDASN